MDPCVLAVGVVAAACCPGNYREALYPLPFFIEILSGPMDPKDQ